MKLQEALIDKMTSWLNNIHDSLSESNVSKLHYLDSFLLELIRVKLCLVHYQPLIYYLRILLMLLENNFQVQFSEILRAGIIGDHLASLYHENLLSKKLRNQKQTWRSGTYSTIPWIYSNNFIDRLLRQIGAYVEVGVAHFQSIVFK